MMQRENPLLALDQKIAGDIYTSTDVETHLRVLCDDFGSRFGGTKGEQQAAQYFKETFEALDLQNVHLEPIEYTGWRRGEASLDIVEPAGRAIPCISLPLSPAGEMTAPLVDLGEGAPEDFDARADEIRGSILMTTSEVHPGGTRRWVHRREKYGRAILAGAVGFIFVNHYPGYGPVTGSVGYQGPGAIPGISVSYEDGAYLQRLLKREDAVTLHLQTTDLCESMTSWNVVGDLVGAVKPEEIVMLGCHYDGHDIAQGAEDPISGAVALLEAARVLAAYAPDVPRTVRFVLWGIEELGLYGSKAYVEAHADDMDAVRFYLNMDSAGAQGNACDVILNEWPELQGLFERWREEMAGTFDVGQSLHTFSDHYPFFKAGVPTGGLETVRSKSGGRGYGHTRYDTLDKVDVDCVREAGIRAARLALRVAQAEDWPAARRSTDAVQALLDSPEYQEEQRYRERIAAYYAAARRE
jgi:Zn-dependent M28 family amino/carboxypeptidase